MTQTFWPRQVRAKPCVGMSAVTKPVDLRQGVSQQQKSVLLNETALLRIKAAIVDIFHAHKVQGFSKIQIAPTAKHARAKLTTHRNKMFPISTFAWSAGRNSGRPVMQSLVRRTGGPPGMFRARLKLVQGKPARVAMTHRAYTQPMICRRSSTRVMSRSAP